MRRRIVMFASALAVLAMGFGYVTPIRASEGTKQYKVAFKAGAKGTINNGASSYEEMHNYKGTVTLSDYEVLVEPNEGYYFTGWSPDTKNSVEVTKKLTFVAQYARVTEEAVYRVNYVDTYGNAVATQKVVTTNDKARISEEARQIEEYAVDAAVKTDTADKNKSKEITFVYTSLREPNVVTETETVVLPGGTTVTVVAGTGTAATPAVNTPAAPTPETPEPGDTTVANPDENVPLGNQDVGEETDTKETPDEETPLANTKVAANSVWVYGVAGIILLGAAAGAVYLLKMRKK